MPKKEWNRDKGKSNEH